MKYQHTWADNGDQISQVYTGTGATTSMMTRTGQQNLNTIIDHRFKTVSRFYLNLFKDDQKQIAIETITQKNNCGQMENLGNFQCAVININFNHSKNRVIQKKNLNEIII